MISVSLAISAIILIIICLLVQPTAIFLLGIGLGVTSFMQTNINPPEETLRAFGQAILDNDQDRARALGSDGMDAILDMLFSSMQTEGANPFERIFNEIEGIDCRENNNDVAICNVCVSSSNDCQDLRLIKEEGQWVVDVGKESNDNEAVGGENDIASHQGRLRGAHNYNLAEVERECDYFSSN